MSRFVYSLAERLGIEPAKFVALVRAMLVMDLRNQAYTRATATKPSHWITPLFWVVGQCLTVSAVTSLVFFMRVDCFFASWTRCEGFWRVICSESRGAQYGDHCHELAQRRVGLYGQ